MAERVINNLYPYYMSSVGFWHKLYAKIQTGPLSTWRKKQAWYMIKQFLTNIWLYLSKQFEIRTHTVEH